MRRRPPTEQPSRACPSSLRFTTFNSPQQSKLASTSKASAGASPSLAWSSLYKAPSSRTLLRSSKSLGRANHGPAMPPCFSASESNLRRRYYDSIVAYAKTSSAERHLSTRSNTFSWNLPVHLQSPRLLSSSPPMRPTCRDSTARRGARAESDMQSCSRTPACPSRLCHPPLSDFMNITRLTSCRRSAPESSSMPRETPWATAKQWCI